MTHGSEGASRGPRQACQGCDRLASRLNELELRYLELQRDVELLSDQLRAVDGRIDEAEARMAFLAEGEAPAQPSLWEELDR